MRRLVLIALIFLTLPAAPAGAAGAAVSMVNARFEPPEVRVPAGSTVTWTNDDSMAHEINADDRSFASSPTCNGATGTGCMAPGDTFSHTFPAAGRYPYHCRLHGSPGKGMTGVVVVG
ncbi:MAG: plastocyanin/azurin family copper-binding protein [Acidimicrobiia bacterium]